MAHKQLTLRQRYEIQAYLQAGISKSRIAILIGTHRSTVYRELLRNKNSMGYHPEMAQLISETRRRTARKQKRFTEDVKERVESLLRVELSPEQISGYLARKHQIQISHERIYQHVWLNKQNGGNLYKHLRWANKKRRKRYGKYDRRGQIPDRVSIDERLSVVDNRERIGDWEVDTVVGKNHRGALLTAIERKTKFTLIDHVPSKKANLVANALVNMLSPFRDRVLTITVDNGKEFTFHKTISKELCADVYFAHPYQAWERGLAENTIGLIRQYFPKKMSFEKVKPWETQFVQSRLNLRPRKTLEYRTPLECFITKTVALET